MILCAMLLCSIAHSIIYTRLFRGKMHYDWFNGIDILQGRWQHGEKVGYCYPSGLEKTLSKWDIYGRSQNNENDSLRSTVGPGKDSGSHGGWRGNPGIFVCPAGHERVSILT